MRIAASIDNQFRITTLYTSFSHSYPPGYSFKGEAHNFYEILIVMDGTIGVLAGNDIINNNEVRLRILLGRLLDGRSKLVADSENRTILGLDQFIDVWSEICIRV